jgi:Fe-Mn family superoxide dismutase
MSAQEGRSEKMETSFTRRSALQMGGAAVVMMAADRAVGQTMPAGVSGLNLPGAFKDGKYTLPDLPYGYDALKPVLTEETLHLHHDKHHAAYVAGMNTALDKLQAARQSGDFAAIRAVSRDLAFNGSGHVLHTIFWNSMKPGGSKMEGDFAKAVNQDFGSADAMTKQLAQASKDVEASGWGVLAYEPIGGKLMVLQAERHEDLTIWGVTPLLVCDVWEHAYYLQYQNKRAEWVDNFLKIANWDFAAQRYMAARAGRGA